MRRSVPLHQEDALRAPRSTSSEPSLRPTRSGLISVVLLVLLLVGGVGLWSACATVPQSEVGFAVGGGPLDPARKKVKGDLLQPGRHITGTFDTVWTYPAYRTLRFQDFDVSITTLDGKKVQVEGQIGLRFVGEQDGRKARAFATGLGARKYGGVIPGDGGGEGWTNFLDQLVAPEITATFKDLFGRVYCADFEPSCRSIDPRKDVPESNPEKVYAVLSKALQQRVDQKLGDSYLRNIAVRVNRISLPREVQTNIDRVTTEQARTQAAKQSVKTAEQEAQAIRVKGRALRANKGLIGLEIAKECQGGDKCTLVVDGTGEGVSPTVRTGK
jgi:regulator of protease activity HflC (stomatin/prohibitin superfamily)